MQKSIKVKPNSVQQRITEEAGGILTISLKSPLVDGNANDELIKLLAKKFAISKSKIIIKLGLSSRQKLVIIDTEN